MSNMINIRINATLLCIIYPTCYTQKNVELRVKKIIIKSNIFSFQFCFGKIMIITNLSTQVFLKLKTIENMIL